MAHVRTQIRQAIAQSVTGLPTTGANVFQGLLYPLTEGDLPCIVITEGDEQVERLTNGMPGVVRRTLPMMLSTTALGSQDLENTLNQIAAEIEVVLGDNLLGGLIKGIALVASTKPDFQDGLQRPAGTRLLVYQITYLTPTNNPETYL